MKKQAIKTQNSQMPHSRRHGRRAPGACRPAAGAGSAGSLNWSLRRYVLASSLRVWLLRQALSEAACPVPLSPSACLVRAVPTHCPARAAGGSPRPPCPVRLPSAAGRRAGRGRCRNPRQGRRIPRPELAIRPPIRTRGGETGVSQARNRAMRYRASGNRQIEYFTQARGAGREDVGCGVAITPRERTRPRNRIATTLSYKPCV
jgi:hypothetical protein